MQSETRTHLTSRRIGKIYLGLLFGVAAMTPAIAEPKTIDDCEKIQAADAYNQCLASFGPVAHEHGVTADPEGGGGGRSGGEHMTTSAEEPRSSHRHGRYERHYGHAVSASRKPDPWANMRHAGRHRVEFSVK